MAIYRALSKLRSVNTDDRLSHEPWIGLLEAAIVNRLMNNVTVGAVEWATVARSPKQKKPSYLGEVAGVR